MCAREGETERVVHARIDACITHAHAHTRTLTNEQKRTPNPSPTDTDDVSPYTSQGHLRRHLFWIFSLICGPLKSPGQIYLFFHLLSTLCQVRQHARLRWCFNLSSKWYFAPFLLCVHGFIVLDTCCAGDCTLFAHGWTRRTP